MVHWIIPWLANLIYSTKGLHGSNKFRNVACCFPPTHPQKVKMHIHTGNTWRSPRIEEQCVLFASQVCLTVRCLLERWCFHGSLTVMVHSRTVLAVMQAGLGLYIPDVVSRRGMHVRSYIRVSLWLNSTAVMHRMGRKSGREVMLNQEMP